MRLFVGRRAQVASYLVVALAASFVVVLALRADGNARHEVHLNDGGVWVSSSSDKSFGRVNKPIDELDAVARIPITADEPELDILQQGPLVVGVDRATSEVHLIDPQAGAIPEGGSTTVAAQSDVALNGGILAVVDRPRGRVWAVFADDEFGFLGLGEVDATHKPVKEIGGNAGATVLGNGDIAVASQEAGKLVVLDSQAGWDEKSSRDLELSGAPQVTAVGQVPVVLDTDTGQLFLDGATATVPPGSVLQQPGPGASSVLVTTPTELLSIGLASGEATVIADGQAGAPSAPVQVGQCSFGAWSGDGSASGSVVTACQGADAVSAAVKGTSLVLRTNRGEVMLNDRASGAVWNIDTDQPQRVDNWKDFAPIRTKDSDGDEKKIEDPHADEQPAKAKPDELGARPGTTTVLHVLDNDQAPAGRLLAINRISEPNNSDVTARISPDAQAILLDVPGGVSGQVNFDYWVDAGNGKDASARVTVPIKGPESQAPPELREGFTKSDQPDYVVAARASLTLSVIGDWRDPSEGDAVSISEVEVDAGRAFVTAAGQIRYQAPATGGQQPITYRVADASGASTEAVVSVAVQGPRSIDAIPADAQPDLARGTVGTPIVVRPLANDIPGADPLNPNATLTLASPVTGRSGLQVTNDNATGEVTIVGSRPGSYLLRYQAGFGDASPSTANIRVDVEDLPDGAESPVTVPDSVTLFGSSQGVVDVLANDYDPQSRLLVTQRAEVVGEPEPVEVSVIDGRWVRLRATGPTTRTTLTVRYTITNGEQSGVTGDIAVRLTPNPDASKDQPVTTDDYATVRAGQAVAIPALDNDFTPSGAPVQLVAGTTGNGDGRLVANPPVGEATATGRMLRYTAPSEVKVAQTVDVGYYATNATGATEQGVAHIRIVPADALSNQPPTPPTLEARVVSGDTVRIKVPAGTADPDGDSVTVTGIGSPTSLGRVMKFGATEIQYQSFPSTAGTDTFEYEVTDPFGATATGIVRVAVVPPDQAQAPVAVDDTLSAQRGRRVTLRILSNDYIGAGDQVEIEPLEDTNADLPDGVELDQAAGSIYLTAGERQVQLRYRITNGLTSSVGAVTVRTVAGYNNPPVVYDAYGSVQGEADSVTIDALEKAYDPDGDAAKLKVVSVGESPAGEVTIRRDGQVVVPLTEFPQVVPYTAQDTDGAVASALLYVPAKPDTGMHLVSDDVIALERGGSLDLDVADLVEDANGATVNLTTVDTDQQAAPAALELLAKNRSTLSLRATNKDYVGPGAITFEVTNGEELGEEGAQTATFTLPVQVGSEQPVFRCPTDPLEIQVGGVAATPDISTICNVWTPDPSMALSLEAEGDDSLSGLEISTDGTKLTLQAPSAMAPTEQPGVLTVRDVESGAEGEIRVRVINTAPPTLTPVVLEGVDAGETRTIDLAGNFTSPLSDAAPRILSITEVRGNVAREEIDGTSASITVNEGTSGRIVWNVEMTDIDSTDPDRRRTATSTITLDVRDVPSRPSQPEAVADDTTVSLSWQPPADNGAPITGYTVKYGGKSQKCGSAPRCTVPGLDNGQTYTFTVTAENAVGQSQESPPSSPVVPDAIPGPVTGLTSGEPRDRQVPISWGKPEKQTSIDYYIVSWPGHARQRTTSTSFVVATASNNQPYTVSVYAVNRKGFGEARTVSVQSSGQPEPADVVVISANDAAGETSAVNVSWEHNNWEGPMGHYVVKRSDGPTYTVPGTERTFRQTLPYDGKEYTYSVTAVNGTPSNPASHTSGPGQTLTYLAAFYAEPPTWNLSEATGTDKQGHFRFTAGEVRGTNATYNLKTSTQTTSGAVTSGGVIDVRVPAGENGANVVPLVQVCNKEWGCTDWVSGTTLIPYGPLNNNAITNFTTGVSGQDTSYSATIDTNGRAATVKITGNRGYSRTLTVDSRSERITGSDNVGFATTQTFTITVSASGRGSISKSQTSPPTADPTPTVTVIKGSSVNETDCNTPSCAYFGARTTGFPGQVTCQARDWEGSVGGWGPWTMGGNTSKISPNYYGHPGDWITVTCNGITSPRFYW